MTRDIRQLIINSDCTVFEANCNKHQALYLKADVVHYAPDYSLVAVQQYTLQIYMQSSFGWVFWGLMEIFIVINVDFWRIISFYFFKSAILLSLRLTREDLN